MSFSGAAPRPRAHRSAFAADFVAGLSAKSKYLPSKHFYDSIGSELFDRICTLDEYYPTRTETALLKAHAREIADLAGPGATIVEFGAGSLAKVRMLLDALVAPRAYVPIDISGEYLHAMIAPLRRTHAGLAVHPVVEDFTQPFLLPVIAGEERRIGFFPGSTIGNLDAAEAVAFLRRAAKMLHGGGLLVGVDLVKDPAVLHAAYNDGEGVTAAFNKNILARANRELDADVKLERFAHYAFYNPARQRVEMHLVSLCRQSIAACGQRFSFAEGETIHTENSHKYTVEGFRALAAAAGFVPRAAWTDPRHLFSMHWLEAGG